MDLGTTKYITYHCGSTKLMRVKINFLVNIIFIPRHMIIINTNTAAKPALLYEDARMLPKCLLLAGTIYYQNFKNSP